MKQKECEVTIQIPYNAKTLEELFRAEEHLKKAGVSFDTGAWLQQEIREWKFDYSLEGAKVLFNKMKEE